MKGCTEGPLNAANDRYVGKRIYEMYLNKYYIHWKIDTKYIEQSAFSDFTFILG